MRLQKHRYLHVPATVVLIAAVTVCCVSESRSAEPPTGRPDQQATSKLPRRTPLVELIERVAPSVVNIMAVKRLPNNETTVSAGTGSILHESGLIITNHHVVRASIQNRVELADGSAYRYRVVAELPYEDLALIRIRARVPLKPVRLGRSHDLMLGEDVLAIGNSQGLRHTVAPGIVSGLNRRVGTSLTASTIQTDAAINPGNSGGPLFNVLGEMIGVVSQKKLGADNISFAIAVDRLRKVFPAMMSPQQRFGLELGMEVDTTAELATVTEVTADSPAHVSGVQVGDVVTHAGQNAMRHGLDFYMSLIDYKPGEIFPLKLRRNEKVVLAMPTLGRFDPPDPVPSEELRKGLQFAAYEGQWSQLPDFDKLKPTATGTCNKFSQAVHPAKKQHGQSNDNFALKLTGFVKVPVEGLYFFYTNSDDGSRLYIGDQLVVDNDREHAALETGGMIRLKAGLYPITVTFFERAGQELLEVYYEGPRLPKQEIPPEALFSRTQEKPPKNAP